MINESLVNELKELRGVRKTQEQFAKELGISKSTYEKYERGEREPSKKFLVRLKELYPDLDINIFFKR